MRACANMQKGKDMTEKMKHKIRLIYGICLTVWTVLVAVLFVVQIWALFRATDVAPYSVETVSKRFSQIAVPFWLWIALLAGGGVISTLIPAEEQRPKAQVSDNKMLARLTGRLPENAEGMVELNKKKALRNMVWIACAVVCIFASVMACVYLLDKNYVVTFATKFYKSHAEAEKLAKIFPWIFVALCVCVGALLYQSYSLKKELALAKKMLADSAKRGEMAVGKGKKEPRQTNEKAKNIIRIVLAAASVALIIIGIFNGGMRDVLEKAINICTQCIGLG